MYKRLDSQVQTLRSSGTANQGPSTRQSMKRITTPIIFWGIASLCISQLCLYARSMGVQVKDTDKIRAVATVYPLKEFAQAVLGDRGEVTLLLPPGAEIHSWRPRPSDLNKISRSDIFICVGAGLEPWVDDILKAMKRPGLKVFRASEGIALVREEGHTHDPRTRHERGHDQGHDHGVMDPHIWLDFGLDQLIIDRLVALMTELMPEKASFFEVNGKHCKKRLRELDKRYEETLSRCRQRSFIMGGHAAFGYLAKRYQLNQIALFGLSPDSTPTPGEMVKVVEIAKEQEIKVIYFEINVSDEMAKVIAQEIGARTLVLSPAANITLEQRDSGMTFFDIMNMNLENLREGLDCE